MITLTDSAAEKIKTMLRAQNCDNYEIKIG